jgi:hypothetical protein
MLGAVGVVGGLLLMSLMLLAPQIRPLANVLVLQRPSEPASQPQPSVTPRANRIAALAQALLGIWVLIGCTQGRWQALERIRWRQRPAAVDDGRNPLAASGFRPARYGADGLTGFMSIRISRERDHRQPAGHFTGPRAGQLQRAAGRGVVDLQQTGGQQQPGAGIGFHHVGRIAAGVPGP